MIYERFYKYITLLDHALLLSNIFKSLIYVVVQLI